MPKAIPIISAFHNLSAGDLADEHGQLCAQIADLETRKRTIAGELIRRGVSEAEGAVPQRHGCRDDGVDARSSGDREGDGRGVDRPVPEILEALGLCQNDGPHRRPSAGGIGRAEQCQTLKTTTRRPPASTGR